MATSGPLPLYLRVGDGPEHKVGHIEAVPEELPGVLRSVAAQLEGKSEQTTGGERREQQGPPRDREIKGPARDRKGMTR